MTQQEIHDVIDQYQVPDETKVSITTGQHLNFACAVLYVQYQYSQVKTDRHAYDPSKWTTQEYKN